MDHGLELVSPGLEIVEIEVSNILCNPRNWKLKSPTFSITLEILETTCFLCSNILEILEI